MRRLLQKLRYWWRQQHCWRCGSRDLRESMSYIRGYNELCTQAYGEDGKRCFDCGFIHFRTPYYEHVERIPEWCKPSSPRPGELFYDAQRKTGIDHWAPGPPQTAK